MPDAGRGPAWGRTPWLPPKCGPGLYRIPFTERRNVPPVAASWFTGGSGVDGADERRNQVSLL